MKNKAMGISIYKNVSYGVRMDENAIRDKLKDGLQVYYVRNQSVNHERERKKAKGIDWTVRMLRDDIMIGGTNADIPEYLTFFGESTYWNTVRECVLIRDEHMCRICGKKAIEVHHIRPRQFGGRNHPRNLISLCAECHDEVHRNIAEGLQRVLEESLHGQKKPQGMTLERFIDR